jgi:hypothetical protein
MKVILLILSLFINSCFFSNDQFDIEGLDNSSSSTTKESPSNNTTTDTLAVESVILSFTIEEDQVIVEGENLDVIEDFSLSGVEDESESVAPLLQFYDMEIIEQTKTRLVAVSRNEDIDLYFDENYALLYKDKQEVATDQQEVIQKDFPFIISRNEEEEEEFEEEKIQDDVDIEGSKLSTEGIEEKQILAFKGDKWVGEDITGQLEYVGTWDPSTNIPAINNQSLKNQTQPGQYYIVTKDDTSYKKGDWMVFDGSDWKQINNKGKVFTFNGRSGVIKAEKDDYTWAMINKAGSKLEDLSDIPIPTPADNSKLFKWDASLSKWVFQDDDSGVEQVTSSEIVDKTLTDLDFATGISISKFKGLQDEIDLLVDIIPLSGAVKLKGSLEFSAGANLTNITKIETPSGTLVIENFSSELDVFDTDLKLDSLGTANNTSGESYLSTNASSILTWKNLDTDHVTESGANQYITQDRVLDTVLDTIVPNTNFDIVATDTVITAFEKLESRLDNEISSTSTISNIQNQSVTLDKLADPGSGTSGYLHFDSTSNSWGLLEITGFNFLGEWDPTINIPELIVGQAFLTITGAPDEFFNSGDFYLISKESTNGPLIAGVSKWSVGDWVVWSGSEWKKIDYTGKITKFFGRTGNIQPSSGDYSWSMIEKINDPSSLSDITDVESGNPTADQVLKWDGAKWIFEEDNSIGQNGGIDGSLITGLMDSHFSANPIDQSKVLGLTDSLDALLEKDTPQIMKGNIDFTNGAVISGVKSLTSSSTPPVSISLVDMDQNFKDANLNLATKQDLISDPTGTPFDSYFLAGDLSMVELDTMHVTEGSNLYFTEGRVQETTIQTVVDNSSVLDPSVLLGDSINILQTKINNRLTGLSVGKDHFKDNIIKPKHFSVSSLSNVSKQFFHYDGTDWEVVEHSGSINFKGTFDPDNTLPDFDTYIVGDYLISSKDSTNGDYKNGDWIIKSSASSTWQQVNAVSKVSGFDFGDNQGGVITAKQNDYTLEQIERTNSTLTSLEDVENQTPTASDLILKYKNGKWSPELDIRGVSKISGYDIAADSLEHKHINQNNKILMDAINGFPFDDYLKKTSGQVMTGDMDFDNYVLENVGVINGVDIPANKLLLDNFSTASGNLELLLPFDQEALNFLDKDKNFVSINLDNIKETTNHKFYNSVSIFATELAGYVIPTSNNYVIAPTDTVLDSLGKLEASLSSQTAVSSIKVFEYENYQVTNVNHLDILVSSYSVYHLPAPSTINVGFTVTMKAQHGPIYIHPNYETTQYSDRPLIDGEDYLILATPGSFARLVYDGTNWNMVDSFGEYSFNISKDDAPDKSDCPYGFISVPGNYLLETDGFCVQQIASQLSEDNMGQDETQHYGTIGLENLSSGQGQYITTIPSTGMPVQVIRSKLYENSDVIAKGQTICGDFKTSENMAGKIGILTKNQLLTIFHDSISTTGDNPLTSSNITTFSRGFPYYYELGNLQVLDPYIHRITNDGLELSSGDIFFLSTYRHDHKICTGQSGTTCTATRYNYHKGSSNELIDWNSLDSGFSYVNSSSCSQATSLTAPLTENFSTFFQGSTEVNSSFDPTTIFYVEEKDNDCDATYFDYFTGIPTETNDYKVNDIYSDTTTTNRYTFNDAITGNNGNSILLLSQDATIEERNKLIFHPDSKRIDGDDINANPKHMVYSRCFYKPEEFTCTLPTPIDPSHDTTNCNTTNGPITEENCKIQCASGYEFFPDDPPIASCTNQGTFTLSGCYDPSLNITKEQEANKIIFDSTSGNVGYWRADKQKVIRDAQGYVGSWTSYPDRDGDETTTTIRPRGTTSYNYWDSEFLYFNGPYLNENNADMSNNPSIHFPSTGGSLYNDSFDGLVNTNAFTRILVTKIDSPSTQSVPYFDGATGMDGYMKSSMYYTYASNTTTDHASVSNFASDTNANKTMISISTFDSTETTNVDKLKLRINARDYSFDYFGSNSLTSPGSGTGIGFGSNKLEQYPYQGNISEVILFDRALSSNEIDTLESHLLVKYGHVKTCNHPSVTTGYDMSNCDDSLESISESECSISCSSPWYSISGITVKATCSSPQGNFSLEGCYGPNNPPTNAEIADAIIASNNVLHMDASFGHDKQNGENITSWDSRPNKDGETHTMTSSTGPTVDDNSSVTPFLNFTGSVNEKLTNVDFVGTNGVEEFTRIFVYKQTKVNDSILYYSLADGLDGYFHYNNFYLRTTSNGSYGKHTKAATYRDTKQVQVTTFDFAQATDTDRLKVSFNGTDIPLAKHTSGDYLGPKDNAPGFGIGDFKYTGTNPFGGELYEVIIFDKKLPDDQIEFLTTQLQKKHGIIKVCELPAVTTGYDVSSCDTSSEMLSQDECNITCDSSSSTHSLVPVKATCSSPQGEFTLRGCYGPNNPLTNAEIADAIIASNNVLHMDASFGHDKQNGENITSWDSRPNKDGETHTMTSSAGPTVDDNSSVTPFLNFTGNANEKLTNADFVGTNGVDEFTRIFVYKPTKQSSSILYYSLAGGYDGYYNGNNFYVKTTYNGSYGFHTKAATYRDIKQVQVTTFDSTQSTNAEMHKVSFNGVDIPLLAPQSTKPIDNAPGFAIGNYWANTNHSFGGELYEAIIFDKKLPDDQIEFLTTQLQKKHGIIKVCEQPTIPVTGYDVSSCDTSSEMLSEDECIVSCNQGYSPSAVVPVKAICSIDEGSFSFQGCYSGVVPAVLLEDDFDSYDSANFLADNNFTNKWEAFTSTNSEIKLEDGKIWAEYSHVDYKAWGGSIYTKEEIDTSKGVVITFNLEYVSSYWNGTQIDGVYIYSKGTPVDHIGWISTYSNPNTAVYIGVKRSAGSRPNYFSNSLSGTESTVSIPNYVASTESVLNYTFTLQIYDGKYKAKIYGSKEVHQDYPYVRGDLPIAEDYSKISLEFWAGDWLAGISKFDNIKVREMVGCEIPTAHVGYEVSGCSGTDQRAISCDVTCSAGYESNDLTGGPDALCPVEGVDMIFTGCKEQ